MASAASGPSEWRTVYRLSAGFFFLFMAFNTVANLVSTLVSDTRLVQTANALLYAVFTASTVVAPAILSRLGARWVLPLGALPYVALVFANLAPGWATFIPAYAAVGVGAALIWTAQGVALSKAAVAEAERTGASVEALNSKFTGFFWTLFQFNGALGLIIASTIFVAAGEDAFKRTVTPLFLGFGGLATLGLAILAPLPCFGNGAAATSTTATAGVRRGGDGGDDDDGHANGLLAAEAAADSEAAAAAPAAAGKAEDTSFVETLRFVATNRAMQLLVPVIFYNGASLGFFQTMYPLSYQDKQNGPDKLLPATYVGFVAATFYLTASACSFLWGQLVPLVGRRPLFLITGATHAVFFALVLLLSLDESLLSVGHATPAAYALVFGLSVNFAVGDSVLESQLPALCQSPAFLPSERDRAAAISNVRLWMSLGFAFQFGVGIAVPGDVWLQAAVLVPVGLLAALGLAVLDRCVRPLSDAASGASGYAIVPSAASDGLAKET